ncbi:hypothetical protein D9758_008077 [Tetrapyrgos nigripes]|uniref:FAD-binding PCMH-type domain-containing protein n=1 Tax=Tetrapyrgos nigripes TaxID=182062 RepID=A0A8H5FWJ4_9AGAR|nr:hypothetical protein D9758_008077 [Tetrapyrgos nigripes]
MWFSNFTTSIPSLSQISPLLSYILNLLPLSTGSNLWLGIPECRIMPGDSSWPSPELWDTLNRSVDGRLTKTIPIASVCHHGPEYDEKRCKYVQENWRRPEFHEEHPSSHMDHIFLNASCDPFTSPSTPCEIGNYVQYTVNVSKPEHIIHALDFAREHNIRFVIKNTGHDYMGKSTGAGALAIWTHHLQDIEYIKNYESSHYSGPAFKLGAGVMGYQIARKAREYGKVVVSGSCSSVGVAGGYIQGGGHSTLSSVYGLGADQALSFEVITPTGRFVTASPSENSDLYWALSGGGGGTYGIVWSVTIKTFPDAPVTVGMVGFAVGDAPSANEDVYYKGIEAYYANSAKWTQGKARLSAFTVHSAARFDVTPVFGYNQSAGDVEEEIRPFLNTLDILGIKYTKSIVTYPNYVDAFFSVPLFQLENQQVGNFLLGNRLLPASLFPPLPASSAVGGSGSHDEDEISSTEDLKKLISIFRDISNKGGAILDAMSQFGVAVSSSSSSSDSASIPKDWNAVHPAWREALHTVATIIPLVNGQSLDVISESQKRITKEFVEPLRKLTPGGGAYLNEASPDEPNFQQSFYGSNYQKLLRIKDKYDPYQMLYGSTAVGGERCSEDWSDSGRLCRVGTGINGRNLKKEVRFSIGSSGTEL